ncbi:unnamed protein product [Prunus armeniaca]
MPPKRCTVFGWISPEQNQGDAPTEGNNVGTECVMDYSDQFTTYSIFNGRDALLRWAREQGKLNNIVIVIKGSDYGGEGKRRPRVILACERNGNYKSCKSSETTDIRSDANNDMKKCARDIGIKKCGCPFLLKGVNIGDGDDWKLEVVCGVHNHPILEYFQGHSFVGRLTKEENALLVDMSKSLVKPRVILPNGYFATAIDGDGCDGSVSEMVRVCWRRWQRASSMVSKLAVKFAEAESSLHSIEPLISGLNIFFRSHYCPIVLKTLLALEGLWHLISMILKTLQHGSYSVAYDNNAISLFFIGSKSLKLKASTGSKSLKLKASFFDYPLASKILVKNIPYSTSENSLQEKFSNFGQIAEVKLVKDETSRRSKGYAYIQYTSQDDAMLALENMDHQVLPCHFSSAFFSQEIS